MQVWFYSSKFDGGKSDEIRRALKIAKIPFNEIDAFGNVQENRQFIHRLSAVPCLIVDLDGQEAVRLAHRREKELDVNDAVDLINGPEMKQMRADRLKELCVTVEIERMAAESLGFDDLKDSKQALIDRMKADIIDLEKSHEALIS